MNAIRAIATIARLTVAEAARRRILWVLLGLTLVSVALTTLGVERLVSLARAGDDASELEIQVGVSQILIFVAFMFSFVLAMTAAVLAAPAIAGDLESGVAHAMLARPIRRADYVIGRWIGLALIVSGYAVISGALEIATIGFVTGYTPPEPAIAIGFLSLQAVTLASLALLLSTRLPAIAAGAVCVVVFGLGWMAGVFAGIGRFFEAGALVSAAEATRWLLPTDGLWRGAIHGLEPPAVVLVAVGRAGRAADANPFFAATPPSGVFVMWSLLWIGVVLALTVVSLRRRDL